MIDIQAKSVNVDCGFPYCRKSYVGQERIEESYLPKGWQIVILETDDQEPEAWASCGNHPEGAW